MTAPALGLGLVGCGSFGAYVLDAVAGLPGLRIAAVADPDPSRARPLGERHGATVRYSNSICIHTRNYECRNGHLLIPNG